MATNTNTTKKTKNTQTKKEGAKKTTTTVMKTSPKKVVKKTASKKTTTKKTPAKKPEKQIIKQEKIEIEKKNLKEEIPEVVPEISLEKKEEQKQDNPQTLLNPNMTLRLILAGIIVLAIIIGIIFNIIKKEEKKEEPTNRIVMLDEEKGKISLDNIQLNDTKTIYFHVKNDSNNDKVYNVETKNIKNDLLDPTKLKYDLYINDKLEISNEIFPSDDMLLIEGALVNANNDLEFKVVLNYQGEDENEDLGKSVSGSIIVVEDND